MKIFFVITLAILFSTLGNCQILVKQALTKEDKMSGVLNKYSYEATDSYAIITLILKKDNTYVYNMNSTASRGISEGKWKICENVLVLESTFQVDNVPVKINYSKNGKFVDSLNIAIVENIKRELLTDVFVLVNNDTTKCLPAIGMCNNIFKKIEKVKIVYENGMSSKWIPVKANQKKISITILTDIPLENYIVMHERRFKLSDNYLNPQ